MSKIEKIYLLIVRRIQWIITYCFPTKMNYGENRVENPISRHLSCAFIPHADDEILGMGSLLEKENIELVYFGYTGSRSDAHNKIIRNNEYKNFCERHYYKTMNYLWDTNLKMLLHRVEFIFLPSIVDWHSEHRKLNWLCCELCEKLGIRPNIVWYNISIPCCSNSNVFYVEMTRGEIKRKYNDFKNFYPSQRNIPVMRFKAKERIYGRESNSFAAEKFVILTFGEWKHNLDVFQKTSMDKDAEELIFYINNINIAAEKAFELYTKFEKKDWYIKDE